MTGIFDCWNAGLNRRCAHEYFSGVAGIFCLFCYGSRFCSVCCAPNLVSRISLEGWFVDCWGLALLPAFCRKNGQDNPPAWLVTMVFETIRAGRPAGIAAAIYAVTVPKPYVLIPLFAALHATGATMVMCLIELFGIRRRLAVFAALPFLIGPTAHLWFTQIHKDTLYAPGLVFCLYGWVYSDANKNLGGGRHAPAKASCFLSVYLYRHISGVGGSTPIHRNIYRVCTDYDHFRALCDGYKSLFWSGGVGECCDYNDCACCSSCFIINHKISKSNSRNVLF